MPSFVTPNSCQSALREVGWTDEARTSSIEKRRARRAEKAAELGPLKFDVPARVRKVITDAAVSGKPLAKDAVLKALPKEAVAKLQARIDQGKEALPEFQDLMGTVAKAFQLPDATAHEFDSVAKDQMAVVGPIKSIERSAEKVVNDYDGDISRLGDIVRGSVVVKTADQARAVLSTFQQNATITHLKNRLDQPLESGYRDVNFRVKLSNGMSGEVQIHVSQVLKAKNTIGHRLYERLRTALPGTATHSKLLNASRSLYNKAWMLSLAGAAVASTVKHR